MKRKYLVVLTMMLWSAGFVFVLGSAAPVSALQLEWNEWTGKTVEASFEHKDRDVSSQTTGIDLFYQGPFYLHSPEEEYADANNPESTLSLSKTGTLPTVFALDPRPDQPDAATTTTVESTRLAENRASFEIALDVNGNSSYNATTTDPSRHDEDMEAYLANPEEFIQEHGAPPPDVECDQNGDCTYYSNWEMTSADSHAYGGYGGTGNIFSVDDGDNIADEQLWVSAVYSYEYDLSGRWTYHTVTNTHQEDDPDDDVTYDERTGYFWTSFQSFLQIGNGVDQFEFAAYDEILRNEITEFSEPYEIMGETLDRVTQQISGQFTTTFSFLVTEGAEYEFNMFADVYGYGDGFADYNSFGLATLDLMVMEDRLHTPEPATSLLIGIGILGLYWYRKRFHKR